ncbi:hypothetical protein ACM40_03620 [Chryseobacterium sp. BLS98]|uniref:head fiber protein n=1 Tax=Chryseobacterium sp. BLS98 TaxID=885586 RepID=UPI00065B086C|nr:head fiber protein [Chryseobacterium sp. BLS98]KMQ63876.1 hypothetical protein ACM40_03620 [Chryseobacterium sp. BLS98]
MSTKNEQTNSSAVFATNNFTANSYDVTDFGTLGTSDDSVVFQNAIDHVKTNGGGQINIPSGTYYANIILDSNIFLNGAGPNTTILKSVSGSHLDVIQGRDFALLTGTPKADPEIRGVRYAGVSNLSIDGNKQNNNAGFGMRIWGCSLYVNNIVVANCKEDGIYTEFTTHDYPLNDFSTTYDALESNFNHIKTVANNGNGWTYKGPHDSEINDYVSFRNGGWALYQEKGSLNGVHWNSWLNSNSFYFGDVVKLDNIVASGETGTGIEFYQAVSSCSITNLTLGGHNTGIILRGERHKISGYAGTIKDVAIINDNAGMCNIELIMYDIKNIYQQINNGSHNVYKIQARLKSGQNIGKNQDWVPHITEHTEIMVYNEGSASYTTIFRIPNDKLWKNGWQPELPDSNSTIICADSFASTIETGVVKKAINQNNSSATTVTELVSDFNTLLLNLKNAGMM